MQQEKLRQRIHYLVEHGGIYPEEECGKKPTTSPLVWVFLGVVLICEVASLILLMR